MSRRLKAQSSSFFFFQGKDVDDEVVPFHLQDTHGKGVRSFDPFAIIPITTGPIDLITREIGHPIILLVFIFFFSLFFFLFLPTLFGCFLLFVVIRRSSSWSTYML